MTTSVLGAITFKISFLRAMAPTMSLSDLEAFYDICERLLDDKTSVEDLQKIDYLYKKFEKKV